MGLRNLYIKEAAKLSLTDNSILVTRRDGKEPLIFPLEDFSLIFVEDPDVVITAHLLTKMSETKTSMVLCGDNYLPAMQVLPLNGHYLQSSILHLQLNLLPYKKKKIWESIVVQKITNQIATINATNADDTCVDRLKEYLHNITPGDETNMEGVAAREYFSSLFGKDFIRFSDSPISFALNYGYSIIASSIIRSVAFSGMYDNIGIWHENDKNNNNLSYDLIEPYRQIVDHFIYFHRAEVGLPLSHDLKVGLLGLLNEQVIMEGKKTKLIFAVQRTVDSYISCLRNNSSGDLLLPSYDYSGGCSNGENIL
jgi:CRISP-associated protein Cas1